ncbi:MAG: dihydroneopterin aldolase [Paracoccaceae bacterium]
MSERAASRDDLPASREDTPDRLFLCDYVRAVEIGAYRAEHGVEQRLAFDIVLEVARPGDPVDDRVERVINYDDLVGAIEAVADGPRLTLLETFAERVAERLLAAPRSRRVRVRIAKLDRLEGGARLGIEIVRDA